MCSAGVPAGCGQRAGFFFLSLRFYFCLVVFDCIWVCLWVLSGWNSKTQRKRVAICLVFVWSVGVLFVLCNLFIFLVFLTI